MTLLTALLLHDYTLPKLILKQSPNFNVSPETNTAQKRTYSSYPNVSCNGMHCVSEVCSLTNAFPVIDLVRPFVTVLNFVGYICPNVLAESLLPVMHDSGKFTDFC